MIRTGDEYILNPLGMMYFPAAVGTSIRYLVHAFRLAFQFLQVLHSFLLTICWTTFFVGDEDTYVLAASAWIGSEGNFLQSIHT